MSPRLSVTKQGQIATKHTVLACGCLGLLFLAMVGFGLHLRTQAAGNILPNRQVLAAPTKIQPELVSALPSHVRAGSERRYSPNYGKLPLSFEANQGQTDARVRFLARGGGYTVFLTDDEAVLGGNGVQGEGTVQGRERSQEPF